MADSLNQSDNLQSPSSPRSWGDGAVSHTPLITWLVPLATSPHPEALLEPTELSLLRTKDARSTQEIRIDLGALCQEPGITGQLSEPTNL